MRFVCDKTPGASPMITQALNPITGSEIRISPPFSWDSPEQLDVFVSNLELLCRTSRHFGQPDPTDVDASTWPSTRDQVAAFRSSLDSFIP